MNKELVLFGVTGDLAKQKLIPALFNLYRSGIISRKSSFIGFGRKKFSKVDFQNFVEEVVLKYATVSGYKDIDTSIIRDYSSQWSYVESELDDSKGYKKLASLLTDQTVVYLSIPPIYQYGVAQMLISSGVLAKSNRRKVAIEKPYGFDLKSSEKLESLLTRKLREEQILRVDHYAGKQALVELEQAAQQGIFKNALSFNTIKKIQVNFTESKDVSMRGSFYDAVGALNDIFQNHMLHMLATILSLPEVQRYQKNISKNDHQHQIILGDIRDKVLGGLTIKDVKNSLVLAQYEGFSATPGVQPNSITETFFRVQGEIKKGRDSVSKRWGGLQIEFVGGKALSESDSSITLVPKSKKDELVKILVNGYGTREAYEQIFIDSFYYNKDRFINFNQIQRGWEIVEKIKKNWKKKGLNKILVYKKGAYPHDISYKS
jgi:glucose-6-phosphate 1-dehydrogenase